MYGPVVGSGWRDVSVAGASAGTGAANSEARTFEKSACGCLRWMMIVPALLSTSMPPIPRLVGFLANASAPRMLRNKGAPAESSLKSRSIVVLKSLALTRAPFE